MVLVQTSDFPLWESARGGCLSLKIDNFFAEWIVTVVSLCRIPPLWRLLIMVSMHSTTINRQDVHVLQINERKYVITQGRMRVALIKVEPMRSRGSALQAPSLALLTRSSSPSPYLAELLPYTAVYSTTFILFHIFLTLFTNTLQHLTKMDTLVARYTRPSYENEGYSSEEYQELSEPTPTLSLKFALPPTAQV